MLEIGKKKLAKEFTVFTVPMGEAHRLVRNEMPFCAVCSKLYGWRGNAYYIGSNTVIYCGYEIIGKKLTEKQIDALCELYDTMTEAEAKAKIASKLSGYAWGFEEL